MIMALMILVPVFDLVTFLYVTMFREEDIERFWTDLN